MKTVTTTLFLIMLAFNIQATTTIIFSDNFANSNQWSITNGDLIVANNIASKEGSPAMTTAFANFSQAISSGEKLRLRFDNNNVNNFATTGWAGVSLYTGGTSGTEQVFIGSPGGATSWGIAGAAIGSNQLMNRTTPVASVEFIYDYDTGDWTLEVSGELLSGTMSAGLAFNAIRIGADINNLADLAVSDMEVAAISCSGAPNTGTDVQTACGSYTWIDGNTYTSDNNMAT